MKRNLKALGLAMVAALALGAVAASAAQAASHHVSVASFPAVVTAKDTVNTVFSITGGEHTVECRTTKYEGTLPEEKNKEVTVTPTYSECQVDPIFGPSATVTVNHCAYVLKGVTDANGDAVAEVECAEGNEITITYTFPFTSHVCTVHVTPQTPGGGVHYEQNGEKIKIEATVTGIKYHETEDEAGSPCPNNFTGEDGTLNGTVEAEGFKDTGTVQTGTEKTTPVLKEGVAQKLTLGAT
jgi:hypothetical protein